MKHTQRYVSNELSHFVGKGQTDEVRYDILVNKILKTGWLTYPPHDISRPRSLSLDFSSLISDDKALKYEVVCFCDIPDSDLGIHVNKYSKFGLAFKKGFLIAKGACPVFYVANESAVSANAVFTPDNFATELIKAAQARGWVDRALYFSTCVRASLDIFAALDAMCCDEDKRFFKGGSVLLTEDFKIRFGQLLGLSAPQIAAAESALRGNELATKNIARFRDFLIAEIFSFIKCFDAKRTFDDGANYYMEREWRIGNHVNFSLADVSRVFFPSGYAKRFRADLPSYVGQISFID
jgi:Putative abortive phage resistance protein AbiGi, antitoxin